MAGPPNLQVYATIVKLTGARHANRTRNMEDELNSQTRLAIFWAALLSAAVLAGALAYTL